MSLFQSELEYGSDQFDTAENLVTKMTELVLAHINSNSNFDKTRFPLQCFFAHMSIVCVFTSNGNESKHILFRNVVRELSKDEHTDLVANLKSLNATNGDQKLFKNLTRTVERTNCSGDHKTEIPKITKQQVHDYVSFLLNEVVIARNAAAKARQDEAAAEVARQEDKAKQEAADKAKQEAADKAKQEAAEQEAAAKPDPAANPAPAAMPTTLTENQSDLINKIKKIGNFHYDEEFVYLTDKDGNYIALTQAEFNEFKGINPDNYGYKDAKAKYEEATKAKEEATKAIDAATKNEKEALKIKTDIEKISNRKTEIPNALKNKSKSITDLKSTLSEFGAIDIDTYKGKSIKDFSNDISVDFDKKKSFWIAFLKMAQLAFVITKYKTKTKITGNENVNFIEDTKQISEINIQAFLQTYTHTVNNNNGGKQSGGKQSNSKQKGGGSEFKFKYVKMLIEKIHEFNDNTTFDNFIASSTGATNVSSSSASKFYDKMRGNQEYQNKNDQQISLCFITVFGYSVDDQRVLQGDSEYKKLLKTILTRTREILTDSDFNQAMLPTTTTHIFTQTDITKPDMFSRGNLEDADQKKFLQKTVVFFNNTNFINNDQSTDEYKSLDKIDKFITNQNYIFGKIITQNNKAKTRVTEGALLTLLDESIKTDFNAALIPLLNVKKTSWYSMNGGSRKRNNKSGKKQLVKGGKKSIKHKISPNKTHKKQ